jgi:hypothetical protein
VDTRVDPDTAVKRIIPAPSKMSIPCRPVICRSLHRPIYPVSSVDRNWLHSAEREQPRVKKQMEFLKVSFSLIRE